MAETVKPNGSHEPVIVDNPQVGTLTSEAIRASGTSVAYDIRALAVTAQQEAELISQEADQLAMNIEEASRALATRVSDYINHLKVTRDSMRSYGDAIVNSQKLEERMAEERLPKAPTIPHE
jgi:hypothetical protein